jgi:hypothetical protein
MEPKNKDGLIHNMKLQYNIFNKYNESMAKKLRVGGPHRKWERQIIFFWCKRNVQ